MKISNITPGILPIPPQGWGAVEKIIWETHQMLLSLGHESEISYLDYVSKDSEVIHIHIANLANLAHERGIPYYFTFHDHHAYLYGKDSPVYKENLRAMKNAIKSFVPAKYLVDYFEGIPEYFSHGVNHLYFSPVEKVKQHKLLCVANNGYIHDQSFDRKGFWFAIEAAKTLGLPITIVGPENNKTYFEKFPSTYEKLTIRYNLSEEELLEVYRSHSIFLHPSELEAGHPNLTLLEALSCGLPIIGTFEPDNSIAGMKVVTRNVEEIVNGIVEVINNYSHYRSEARKEAERLSWYNRTKELLNIYEKIEYTDMRKELLSHYSKTPILRKTLSKRVNLNCIDGMFVEILGGPDVTYLVKFIDNSTNTLVFETEIGRNCWARTGAKYYVDWKVQIVEKQSGLTETYHLNLKNKRVYIALESKSLGDTLAWLPYVEEFRKKHDCEMICTTFWNHLFESQYSNITFVPPGETIHNLVALYRLGLFYVDGVIDRDRHTSNPIHQPLQKISSDILGLPYKEIRPLIKQPDVSNTDSKQICIATHSTAQAKYWNNPSGWQEVVDWLVSKGYTVRLLSKEGDNYMGNKNPTNVIYHPDSPIDSAIEELKKSKLFIGLGSGLSWLSWAVNTPTVLISGFSYKWAEMQDCIRVGPPTGKCEGCFNRHRLDAGDWNWCPDHKGTPRQFECTREITSQMVINELEKLL